MTTARATEMLRALAQAQPNLVLVADATGRVVLANDAFVRFTGLGDAGLTGDGWLEPVHVDDRTVVEAAWREAVATFEPYEAECRLLSADGHYLWFLVRGSLARANGVLDHWVVAWTDINDRKAKAALAEGARQRTQDALDESEARYRTVFQSMFSFTGLLSTDGDLLDANDTALAFEGVQASEAIGRKFWDLPRWSGSESGRRALREAIAAAAGGAFVRYEADVHLAGGDEATIDFSLKPVFAADGRVDRIIAEGRDLTEAKTARQALGDSEARLRSIFDNAAVGIARLDLVGERWLEVNDTLCGLVGYSRAELVAKSWRLITHPDDVETLSLGHMAAGRLGAFAVEKRFIHRRGHTVWLRITLSAVAEPGAPAEVGVAVIEDISERKRQEASLAEDRSSKAFLLALADRLGPLQDAGEVMAVASRMLAEALGSTRVGYGEVSDDGESLSIAGEWRPPTAPAATVRMRLEAFGPLLIADLRRGVTTRIDDVSRDYRTRDPQVVAVFNSGAVRAAVGAPLVKDGRLRGVFFVTDARPREWTTGEVELVEEVCARTWSALERARAEAELARTEARLQRIVRSGIIGIGWGDASGGVTDVNDAFLAMIGRSRADFEAGAINWRDLTAPEYADRDEAAMAELVRAGASQPYEKEYILGDRRLPLLVTVAAIDPLNPRGDHVAVLVDLTAQKAAQAALAEANARLESRVAERTAELRRLNERLIEEIRRREAVQARRVQSEQLEVLGQLTSSVVHDFNNVLAVILGSLSLIRRRGDDRRVQALAEEGVKAVDRGASLVRQLLAFVRRQAPGTQVVDLGELFDELAPQLRHLLGQNVALLLELPPAPPRVIIDSAQLHAALVNLAVNARDAMPGGGALRYRVEIVNPQDEGYPAKLAGVPAVVIHVQDTGRGMPPAVLQRVLEPFYTTKASGKGTGLGLAMVNGLVLQAGGALRIESSVDRGTTISLYLPASAPESPGEAEEPEESDVLRHTGGLAMLVEDDPGVRTVISEQLADLGYAVMTPGDVTEALVLAEHIQAAHGARPEFVICDLLLAQEDGRELGAELRRRWPDMPVLFVTGQPDAEPSPGEHILRKPFSPEALSRAILEVREHAARRAEVDRAAEGVAARIRAPALAQASEAWRRARGARILPPHAAVALADPPGEHVGLVKVDQTRAPMAFRLVAAGAEVRRRLDGRWLGNRLEVEGDDTEASWEGLYRRCVRSGKPTHEYARFGFGDGQPLTFERLLLPCADVEGVIDTLIVSIWFTGEAAPSPGGLR